MDQFTERGALIGCSLIDYLSVEVVGNHIACPGGAVVVEIIVTIFAVLRAVVLPDGICDAQLLLRGEVELLLLHPAPLGLVFAKESLEGIDAHEIVGESEHETAHEIGLVEVEDTPIHGHVRIVRVVNEMQGRMAVDGIGFAPRAASDETHAEGGVDMGFGFRCQLLLGMAFQPAHEEQEQGQKSRPEKSVFAFHGAKVHFLFLNKVRKNNNIPKNCENRRPLHKKRIKFFVVCPFYRNFAP